ncbi:hypothetical protein DFA_04979 [Cavenderia fasciculata]|uniref:Uncharacterized protein n=1 Tax=Cavenderia fasciculata TaxID=261658 RepID=F4PMQ2_CACFS|nr:uncharacterized protein DFA_04979 [Cavenderia fasciculata]EGG22849.1 hypothetical protein DFA_04979 [Cavenderia fasciculata]|eukprot:XP_004360700.1 hypothetical protein DFA_04979 [Cavenderia fasciculata]
MIEYLFSNITIIFISTTLVFISFKLKYYESKWEQEYIDLARTFIEESYEEYKSLISDKPDEPIKKKQSLIDMSDLLMFCAGTPPQEEDELSNVKGSYAQLGESFMGVPLDQEFQFKMSTIFQSW